jgi:hypothetical protein
MNLKMQRLGLSPKEKTDAEIQKKGKLFAHVIALP